VIGNRVKFVTNDGRVFVGVLKGLDQTLNCVISHAEERVYSEQAGVALHPLGTYFIRGECIVAMGEFVETEEDLEGLEDVRAKPIAIDS
jgi:U6 snRNA-associated Sm-like protein LSm8